MKKLILPLVTLLMISANIHATNKAIYGDFDVINTIDAPDIKIRKNAQSVALMIAKRNLRMEIKDVIYSAASTKFNIRFNTCDEKFPATDLALGSCSSILVGENKLLTAGHCMLNAQWDCDQKAFVFDVKKEFISDSKRQYFVQSQVYQCKSILKHVNDPISGIDFALIELDRKVAGRSPIKLSSVDLDLESKIYMIGHPLGLVSKTSMVGDVRLSKENMYVANIDSFVGNSGAPVFSMIDNSLSGLLVRGEEDFEWDSENKCYKYVQCEDGSCRGEDIIKSSVIASEIAEFLD